MTESFEHTQTFDETALEQLHELQIEGEPSFVNGLITDYLAQVKELSETIQAQEAGGDRLNLERSAHKLKSSSAVLGVMKVAGLCRAIEDAAHKAEPTKELVAKLAQAVTEAIGALEKYIASGGANRVP